MENRIYLDYNATTPCDPAVVEAMLPYFSKTFGNPSSAHHPHGWLARETVRESTESIARNLGVDPDDLIFTSGATESINMVLKSLAQGSSAAKNHVITSSVEHKAVLDVCAYLEQEGMARVTYLEVDSNGIIDLDQLEAAICPETILAAIMHSNNETGVIQPLDRIRAILRGKGIALFSDATQSLGKVSIDPVLDSVDYACFSAHKLYGPKGIGLLYVRNRGENTFLKTLIHGGGQQKKMRGGTLNTPAIAGFAKAVELSSSSLRAEEIRLKELRDRLETGLKSIEHSTVNGGSVPRLPNTLNMSFAYVEGFRLLSALSKHMAVSNGSACNSANENPSHVLTAMGVNPDLAFASIRFSLGKFTSETEIDDTISILKELVAKQRAENILWERRAR